MTGGNQISKRRQQYMSPSWNRNLKFALSSPQDSNVDAGARDEIGRECSHRILLSSMNNIVCRPTQSSLRNMLTKSFVLNARPSARQPHCLCQAFSLAAKSTASIFSREGEKICTIIDRSTCLTFISQENEHASSE